MGVPNKVESLQREKRVVQWLNQIEPNASEIFLMGDLFDFWYDYATVIPKGFVRLQGKIAALTDAGIKVHIFPGNHDMWLFGYFEEELGVIFHKDFYQFQAMGANFLLHHGDGIGPGDNGYKFLKKVFSNGFLKWCFKWLHPDIGIGVANFWSQKSSKKTRHKDAIYKGKENEWLVTFCEDELKKNPKLDYFVMGHRHLPLDIALSNNKSRYINLGDWISHFTYAKFDGEKMELLRFTSEGKHEKVTDLPSD